MGNGLQVIRVAALGHATQVVDYVATGDNSSGQFIREAMGSNQLRFRAGSHLHHAVSVGTDGPRPNPAAPQFWREVWDGAILVDPGPKSLLRRSSHD